MKYSVLRIGEQMAVICRDKASLSIFTHFPMPEIIVGVIKPTRFDPKPDKRLFIYRIADEAYIRPLWLGSRVAQPLENFKVIREHTPVLIRTMERERSGKFLIAEYAWGGFGLDFKEYLKRETEEKEAKRILKR